VRRRGAVLAYRTGQAMSTLATIEPPVYTLQGSAVGPGDALSGAINIGVF